MKKIFTILAVLICISISMTAYAQSKPEAEPGAQINPNANVGTGENVNDILPVPEAEPGAQINPNANVGTDENDNDILPVPEAEPGAQVNPNANAGTGENVNDILPIDDNKSNQFNMWILTFGGLFIFAIAAILFVNRTRFIPAMQTANGNVVTGNAPISRKQTISAIKNSTVTPSDNVFNSIMERVDNQKK